MDTLVKYFENNLYTIYYCNGHYISVTKNISSNIKTYLTIVNDDNIIISKLVDNNSNNCIFYIYRSISNNYSLELENIKKLINTVYNYLLKNNKTRSDFIKKVEIINDGKNSDFIRYLCNNSNGKFVIWGSSSNSTNNDYIFSNNIVNNFINPLVTNDGDKSGVGASHGSIKWYTVCFILILSIVVGVSFSVYVLK